MATLKDKMKSWLKGKQDYNTGVQLIGQFESKYADYFKENSGAKKGTMPHNLLVNRIQRAIRILEQQEMRQPKSTSAVQSEPKKTEEKKSQPISEGEGNQTDPEENTDGDEKIGKGKGQDKKK